MFYIRKKMLFLRLRKGLFAAATRKKYFYAYQPSVWWSFRWKSNLFHQIFGKNIFELLLDFYFDLLKSHIWCVLFHQNILLLLTFQFLAYYISAHLQVYWKRIILFHEVKMKIHSSSQSECITSRTCIFDEFQHNLT